MKKSLVLLLNEKAAVTVLVAFTMTVLIGFCALVTDVGLLYINRGRMVNALDSAVLAGVQELPDQESALNTASNYADMNGLLSSEYVFQLGEENRSISGTASRKVALLFARVLGFENRTIIAFSKAHIAPVSSVKGAVPFGVLEDDFTIGQEVVLKEGTDNNFYPGWFGALRLGGTGADVYRDNIKYGYSEEIVIDDVAGIEIDLESGNMWGPTMDGINYRISQCNHTPQCTIASYVDGCSRILIVPIINIEETNPAGRPSSVRIVGFAAFFVEEYIGDETNNEVRGRFMNYVIPGKTNEGVGDFGLYTAKLCE